MIWPATYFVNEVILEHSYAHVFAYCSCASTAELNSCDKHHHVACRSLEHVLSGLLQKCFFTLLYRNRKTKVTLLQKPRPGKKGLVPTMMVWLTDWGRPKEKTILEVMGPSRLGQKGPVKIILPFKRESGGRLALKSPHIGDAKENAWQQEWKKKWNNKSKAVSSFRMAKHTKFMKSYYISQLKGYWWEH